MTTNGRAAFTTAVRVINRVHGQLRTCGRLPFQRIRPALLIDVRLSALPTRRWWRGGGLRALRIAGGRPQGEAAFLSDELHGGASGAGDLGAATRVESTAHNGTQGIAAAASCRLANAGPI